jgi:hypothetical protein
MARATERLATRDMKKDPRQGTGGLKMRMSERFRIAQSIFGRRRADNLDHLLPRRSQQADPHSPYQIHIHAK